MSEMVEKVARAIAENPPAERMEIKGGDWVIVRDYEGTARAAIEAMRDADGDMLEAMHNAMFVDKFNATSLPMLGAGFEAAIDAALKDKP